MAKEKDEQIAALEAANAEKDQVIESLVAQLATASSTASVKVIEIDGKRYALKYPTIVHDGQTYTVEQIEANPELAQALLDLDCGVLELTV